MDESPQRFLGSDGVSISVSEPGKVEERRSTDVNLYHLLRKAENGLGSDILPQELREFTPVEIRSSVAEAGKIRLSHVTVDGEAIGLVR